MLDSVGFGDLSVQNRLAVHGEFNVRAQKLGSLGADLLHLNIRGHNRSDQLDVILGSGYSHVQTPLTA